MMLAVSITKGIYDKRISRRDLIPVERQNATSRHPGGMKYFFRRNAIVLPICRPYRDDFIAAVPSFYRYVVPAGQHYHGCQSFYRYPVPAGQHYHGCQSFYRYPVPAGRFNPSSFIIFLILNPDLILIITI
jgi:hypothetical protein